MLSEMKGVSLGELARKAIEDAFEGRNDREYARICITEDLEDLIAEWDRNMGTTTSSTVTSTEDGFRAVIVSLKDFNG